LGHRVLHFSGSEVHQDPVHVFSEVFYAAASEWQSYRSALRKANAQLHSGRGGRAVAGESLAVR